MGVTIKDEDYLKTIVKGILPILNSIQHQAVISDPQYIYLKEYMEEYSKYLDFVSIAWTPDNQITAIKAQFDALIPQLSNLKANGNNQHLVKSMSFLQNIQNQRIHLYPAIMVDPELAKLKKRFESVIEKADLEKKTLTDFNIESKAKFESFLEIRTSEFENLREDLKEKSKEYDVNREKQIKNLLKEAKDNVKDIKNLSSLQASEAITTGFKNSAKLELKLKWVWHGVFLISIGAIIWFSRDLIKLANKDIADYSSFYFIIRFFISIPLGIIATYAARQSKNNDIYEKRYRQKELDLTAVNPFIANLAPAKRDEIIEELSRNLFNKDDRELEMSKFKESFSVFEEFTKLIQSLPLSFFGKKENNPKE